MRLDPSGRSQIGAAVGSLGALFTAAALVGVRGEIQSANVALVLVLWVLLGAVTGGRGAGVISALVAAISFDFFHTKPYGSFKIADGNDVLTMVLLVAVGVAAGEIAIRAQRFHAQQVEEQQQLRRMQRVASLAAASEGVDDLVSAVTAELIATLELKECWFERPPFATPLPTIGRNGTIATAAHRFANGDFELPREGVALPVTGGGSVVGRFVLRPTAGVGVSRERRLSAIGLADQVGAALAASAA